jgi:uncharacterized MAPEG superfamily protein
MENDDLIAILEGVDNDEILIICWLYIYIRIYYVPT